MRKTLAICLLLPLLFCGDDLVLKEPVPMSPAAGEKALVRRSGSRLKVLTTVIESEDGAALSFQSGSFYDSQLKTHCSFQQSEDGMVRCLPPTAQRYGAYLDAACTLGLAYSSKCGPSLRYAAVPTRDRCSAGRIVETREVERPGVLYFKQGAECTIGNNPIDDQYRFYEIGREVPAASFVAAAAREEQLP